MPDSADMPDNVQRAVLAYQSVRYHQRKTEAFWVYLRDLTDALSPEEYREYAARTAEFEQRGGSDYGV